MIILYPAVATARVISVPIPPSAPVMICLLYTSEVEMPEEEMAIRRINFYKRQGFTLWEKPYMQPPYKSGDDYLPMLLMAYGDLECDKDFEQVKKCIYREVYNTK